MKPEQQILADIIGYSPIFLVIAAAIVIMANEEKIKGVLTRLHLRKK